MQGIIRASVLGRSGEIEDRCRWLEIGLFVTVPPCPLKAVGMAPVTRREWQAGSLEQLPGAMPTALSGHVREVILGHILSSTAINGSDGACGAILGTEVRVIDLSITPPAVRGTADTGIPSISTLGIRKRSI